VRATITDVALTERAAAGTELLAELLQLVLEAPDADAEPSGGLGAVAPRGLQGFEDVAALDLA
jgi:hypothetical protein